MRCHDRATQVGRCRVTCCSTLVSLDRLSNLLRSSVSGWSSTLVSPSRRWSADRSDGGGGAAAAMHEKSSTDWLTARPQAWQRLVGDTSFVPCFTSDATATTARRRRRRCRSSSSSSSSRCCRCCRRNSSRPTSRRSRRCRPRVFARRRRPERTQSQLIEMVARGL